MCVCSFRSSLFSVLIYAHFLRMRYYMSSDMRHFLTDFGTKIDQLLTPPTAHASIPPAVLKAYATAKEKLSAKTNPTPPPAAAAATTAAPTATATKKTL